jgi:hypothetical protein
MIESDERMALKHARMIERDATKILNHSTNALKDESIIERDATKIFNHSSIA